MSAIPIRSMPRRIQPLSVLVVLLVFSCNPSEASDWTQAHPFRVVVTASSEHGPLKNSPTGVEIDFAQLLAAQAAADARPLRVNPDSIRVVDAVGRVVPHTTTGDVWNRDRATIWWRSSGGASQRFEIYFDCGERRGRPQREQIGLVGVGDTFHYGGSTPRAVNALPLHSQFNYVDWDGDGVRDLLGWGYRVWEHGEGITKGLGNAVYFMQNIGSERQPLFRPRRRVVDSNGDYLTSQLLPQNMFPVDWDEDGDVDFIGMGRSYQLMFWNNTGRRDADGLLLLDPPEVVLTLNQESRFRQSTPGILRKSRNWFPRGVRRVDWEGDGDFDLIVAFRKVHRLRSVDASQGVIPYGTAVVVFDLFENTGQTAEGQTEYAAPVTLHEETGFPLRARGHANGGPEYIDWDGDGDRDLLFHDETDRPLEGGRMMFAENRGTRAAPLFEAPIPILPITDSPFAVDWDGDSLVDVIAGGEFFRNVNSHSRQPVQPRTDAGTRVPRVENFPRLESMGLARQVQPEVLSYFTVSVDWDDDGDLDLLGGYHTTLRLFNNRGTTLEPVFDEPIGIEAGGQPLSMPNFLDLDRDPPSTYGPQGPTEAIYGWLCPTVVDWDGDGDLDLFATGQCWQTRYFENVGTRSRPVLAGGRLVVCDGRTDEFSWRSKVSAGDLDGDGQMELVVTSDRDNVFYLYEMTPQQADSGRLSFQRGQPLRLESGETVQGWYGGQNNNGDNHSLLVDWDRDGDLDLINGSLWSVWYYENVGEANRPVFQSHGAWKLGGELLHTFSHAGSFDAADWNADGQLDLVLGTECPSDQPHGAVLHLFDRNYLEGRLPSTTLGPLEFKP